MPGEVNTTDAASVDRFLASQLSALPGQITSGRQLVRRLVVTLGEDHPLGRLTVEVLGDRVTKLEHVPIGVVDDRRQRPHRMQEDAVHWLSKPALRRRTCSSSRCRPSPPRS